MNSEYLTVIFFSLLGIFISLDSNNLLLLVLCLELLSINSFYIYLLLVSLMGQLVVLTILVLSGVSGLVFVVVSVQGYNSNQLFSIE